MNFVIASTSILRGMKEPHEAVATDIPPSAGSGSTGKTEASHPLTLFILFLTGFGSLAMEVVWTRAFTRVLSTTIYSFAAILASYLLATYVGTLWYREAVQRRRQWSIERCLQWVAVAAVLPILLGDPRLAPGPLTVLLSIVPFCLLLGYLTPKLLDEHAHGHPASLGAAYALNIVGGILGPLAAGYLLLPSIGVKYSLIVLALPFIFLTMAPSIGVTSLTTITKFMAHLPMAFLGKEPKSSLVICLGMGTIFRSLTSWGAAATAVELVPSVRQAFGYFFADAETVLANPQNQIIVDDGRRFLRRTDRAYDVITMDPPPPMESAGLSLLFSTEFYEIVKKHLNPGGVFQQWVAVKEKRIAMAAARSLVASFPYVKVFISVEDWGYHFIASESPIPAMTAEQMLQRMPESAKRDAAEWLVGQSLEDAVRHVLGSEFDIHQLLDENPSVIITDDHPFNEYFVLRRLGNR